MTELIKPQEKHELIKSGVECPNGFEIKVDYRGFDIVYSGTIGCKLMCQFGVDEPDMDDRRKCGYKSKKRRETITMISEDVAK